MSKNISALEIAEELAQARFDKQNELKRQSAINLVQHIIDEREKWGPVVELLEQSAAKYPELVSCSPPYQAGGRFKFQLGRRYHRSDAERILGGRDKNLQWAILYGTYGDLLYHKAETRDELLLWLIDEIASLIPAPTTQP